MRARRLFEYAHYDLGVVTMGDRLLVCANSELPADFPLRLCRLKELTGLSWNEFAEVIGCDVKQVLRWRQGAEPDGGAMLGIVWIASQVPGGLNVLMGAEFMGFLAVS